MHLNGVWNISIVDQRNIPLLSVFYHFDVNRNVLNSDDVDYEVNEPYNMFFLYIANCLWWTVNIIHTALYIRKNVIISKIWHNIYDLISMISEKIIEILIQLKTIYFTNCKLQLSIIIIIRNIYYSLPVFQKTLVLSSNLILSNFHVAQSRILWRLFVFF